jgi:hypothetical protein
MSVWLLALAGGVAAAEPVTTISVGTIVSVLSTLMSIVSILIDIVKYTITYTLFFAIIVLIFIQFIPIVRKLDLIGFAQRLVGDSLRCSPAGPSKTQVDTIPRQKQLA